MQVFLRIFLRELDKSDMQGKSDGADCLESDD